MTLSLNGAGMHCGHLKSLLKLPSEVVWLMQADIVPTFLETVFDVIFVMIVNEDDDEKQTLIGEENGESFEIYRHPIILPEFY
jgi:hypothetical protein